MPWPIRYFESWEAVVATHGHNPPIGTMWPEPEQLDRVVGGRRRISPEYFRDWADKRPPLMVIVPDRNGPDPGSVEFCIDSVTIKDGVLGTNGWTVTGEPPRITLTPSVDIKGGWHGFITDGEVR